MSLSERDLRAIIRDTTDIVLSEPDPVQRLRAILVLHEASTRVLRRDGERVAYDVWASGVALHHIADMIGVNRQTVSKWVHHYGRLNDLPVPGVTAIEGQPVVLPKGPHPYLRFRRK